MKFISALISGLLFGYGLSVAEMTDPVKVLAFLDVTGNWDPSLALVMIGALCVSIPGSYFILKKERPFVGHRFHIPTTKLIDSRLVSGSVIFGIGWGLAGYCPGPILTNISLGTASIFWVTASYLVGTYATVKLNQSLVTKSVGAPITIN